MNRRHFLAGAALLAVSAIARRRPHLLPEDSRPPDFTLPDADGRYVTTTPFFGHKRVVLLFVPKSHEAQGRAYLKGVEREGARFADRDLAVLLVAAPGVLAADASAPPVTILHDNREKAACVYEVGADGVAFYLIGKDGGIKMARRDIPSDAELFAVIDAMPMRRREARGRGH